MENHIFFVHCNTCNAILFDVRVLRCVVINLQVPLTYLTARRDFME